MKTMKVLPVAFILLCLSLLAGQLYAAIEEVSFDTEQEMARYQKLIAELRCPKCMNANLAGSDAPIAHDLRAVIRDQIKAGQSDEQIIDFMTARYGDFILYRPPLNKGTLLLWFGPPLLLLSGFVIVRRMIRISSTADSSASLSQQEQQKLQQLLAAEQDKTEQS